MCDYMCDYVLFYIVQSLFFDIIESISPYILRFTYNIESKYQSLIFTNQADLQTKSIRFTNKIKPIYSLNRTENGSQI